MEITGTKIYMTRGDTESLTVEVIGSDGILIPLTEGTDIIYFTVKKSVHVTQILLQKIITTFTDGRAEIFLEQGDTKDLSYGIYIYDVQWNRGTSAVSTIIKKSTFMVGEEVTYE